MKTTIKNKIKFILVLIAAVIIAGSANAAGAKRVKKISIYNEAKYADSFKHFEYVNPNAPKGGRIVIPNYGGFDNFNPFIFKGMAPSMPASITLDTLGYTPVDDIASVYPLLAKEFEVANDGTFIGFILNEQAKFSDGAPVTADDVVFSFEAITQKGSPLYKMYYGDVERAERVSKHHVRFYFKEGTKNRELPIIISQIPIFSEKYWEGRDFSQPKLEPYLGSGAYVIDKFEAGKYIVFKRRPDYWAKDLPSRKGFFNFDEIRMDYYQDTTVTLQALFSGNIDVREEYIAKIWVTGYDNDLVKSGRVIKENMAHNRAAILQHFAFNVRKDKFKDRRVREAIGLAFDFDWASDKLFYNQYERLYSHFTNTGMEATGKPQGRELQILKKYKKELPASVFDEVNVNPKHGSHEETRENLKKAVKLLNEAGYDFIDGKMTHKETGEALKLEVLSNSSNGSTFTRVMLPFIKNLKKIGIEMVFRNLEVNIFKNRLDNFDYDMAIISYRISQMPGSEIREYWGSRAADVKGSMNIIGIKNEVVDELIKGVIESKDKKEYEAYVKALDRVLLNEHYMIFQWYSGYQRVAYWNKFDIPKSDVKAGFDIDTWSARAATAAK
ncbi:MAG: extracellular solute-binding protein [Lactobacillus sp.]|jgi:microcin C transport system substrate-binding protein|nr:extracellular solute-binding protein [Lactobacillus sp.]